MPLYEFIIRLVFRISELCFAAIVLGVDAQYIAENSHAGSAALAPFIYTEIVAGLAIIAAVVRMLPYGRSLVIVPVDVAMTVMWWIVFGIAVGGVGDSCGSPANWDNVELGKSSCGKIKAGIAFSFLSALFWLISAIAAIFWERAAEKRAEKKTKEQPSTSQV